MISFTALIKKFATQAEKTGWTYIEIPADIANELKPGTKKSFRVKGTLDSYAINTVALLPMGGGTFIMPLNATFRKGIRKGVGAMVQVRLEADERQREIPAGLLECLADEPEALDNYNCLSKSHKGYFTVWINGVKTDAARAKRIAQTVTAMAKGQDFVQLMHSLKKDREDFFR